MISCPTPAAVGAAGARVNEPRKETLHAARGLALPMAKVASGSRMSQLERGTTDDVGEGVGDGVVVENVGGD